MFTQKFLPATTILAAWMFATGVLTAAEPAANSHKEDELLAVLRSDAPPGEKAITCKLLAIYGSDAAVPELAGLLADPELASWARIALEPIPGPAANEALRRAIPTLEGRLLVGVINSIGVRRDPEAVEVLQAPLRSDNVQVASAAAVALGHIGSDAATRSLETFLSDAPPDVRSAVAEGCVLCAERLLAEGKRERAAALYDRVRQADVPQQRILEATRGAILARGDEGLALLLEQFRSDDKKQFQMALSTFREFPGAQVDRAVAEAVSEAAPQRAALMIRAMADRPETVHLPALVRAAGEGPRPVRLAALEALGRVGDASTLSTLLDSARDSDADVAAAAQAALAALQGEDVDAAIVARLSPSSRGPLYRTLIELVGKRRLRATPELTEALGHADPAVRSAALYALGETVTFDELPLLLSQVVKPTAAQDAEAAQKALRAASIRMADREACASALVEALDSTPSVETKQALLEILGEVGGPTALKAMEAAATGPVVQLQDVSTRLLGEWMTADAAPVLLRLADPDRPSRFQVRALRGFIRIARQFDLPPEERLAMCRQALVAAEQPAEKRLVLEVLERYPSPGTFDVAVDLMRRNRELKSEAMQTVMAIAQKLEESPDALRRRLEGAGLEPVKLEVVRAEYGAGQDRKDVTAAVREHARDFPLIVLPSESFNRAFGGDPAPGRRKELRIEYRMDGKRGEATLPENAPIILPLPE